MNYNPVVLKPRYLPDADRLSVLAATILLAYALGRFVNLPSSNLAVQLPFVYLSVQVNFRTFVTLVVATLTAIGADWLLRDHPALRATNTLEHWLLPGLTAWVIGFPLYQLPMGPLWWLGVGLGGGLLMLVLVAEYIVVDPDDVRLAPAAAGLTAVSFALYLILAVAVRYSGLRLFLVLPTLTFGAWLVSLRAIHLRLHGKWAFLDSIIVALVMAQLIAALHYWPLAPASFGLALLGPTYALTSLIASLEEGEPLRKAVIEPLVVLALIWGAAVWIR